MFFVSGFCFFLAIYFGIVGFRNNDNDFKGLALAFLFAGIGTAVITIFAFSALQ